MIQHYNSAINNRAEFAKAQIYLQENSTVNNNLLKKGIWIYFFLLIFEGALRKWVFPGLATPLLIIRDPLALWLILMCTKRGLLPANFYLFIMILVAAVSTFTTLFFGHGNLQVTAK